MPATNLAAYMQLADETASRITYTHQEWTGFLKTAARLYKYPYHEQLMVYAQRPDATACAEYGLWNSKMRRYVRRGSKGIALVDSAEGKPRLRYVFDIADTGATEKSQPFKLWELNEQNQEAAALALENGYDVPAREGLERQIHVVAMQLSQNNWLDHRSEILGIVDGSFLEGYDEFNVGAAFRKAASVSLEYALLSRCGLDPDRRFEHEDFLPIFDWNTPDAVSVLGTAISEMSEEVLRTIEINVRNYERSHKHERSDLSSGRGLPDSRLDRTRNGAPDQQVREDAQDVPAKEPSNIVQFPDRQRATIPAPAGDRGRGEQPIGAADARTDETERRDGTVESHRSDEVGRADEQLQGAGRGSDSQRADLQLNTPAEQPNVQPETNDHQLLGEEAPPPQGEVQLSFFPTEAAQIAQINRAESDMPSALVFAAQRFSDAEIDAVLQCGSNQQNSSMRIVTEFSKGKSKAELAAFLQQKYRGGLGIETPSGKVSAWFDKDGMRLCVGSAARYVPTAQVIPWVDVVDRIDGLLERGEYATMDELYLTGPLERKSIAEALWYLRQETAEEAIQQGFLPILDANYRGGFPESTERIAALLEQPEQRQAITEEVRAFATAYAQDRSVLNHHFHKPAELLPPLEELELPRTVYESKLLEPVNEKLFITQDEVDVELSSGGNVSGGKKRIYQYFQNHSSTTDRAAFLKNEYGIGGHSHALMGADGAWEDHDTRGIRFRKDHCEAVTIAWPKAAKRIDSLIAHGRYLNDETISKRKQAATPETVVSPSYADYEVAKAQHPDDIVLYQVGDFFEMYGEDAKTAATVLDINLTSRAVGGAERIPMCGVPSHNLEHYVEQLRDQYDVTVSAVDASSGERRVYTLLSVDHEAERAIDAHEAEFGADGHRAFPNNVPDATQSTDRELFERHMPARYQVVAYHHFENGFDERLEYQTLREAEQAVQGYVDGTLDAEGFSYDGAAIYDLHEKQYIRIVGDFPDEKAQTDVLEASIAPAISQPAPFYAVGDTLYLEDGKAFIIEAVDDSDIRLRDPSLTYPITRVENKERLARLLERYPQPDHHAPEVQPKSKTTSETVAVYPAEENHLPYDVVIERLHVDEPARDTPATADITPRTENFRITDDHLGEGGAKTKYQWNVEAIRTLQAIEAENRHATPEEQETLSRYVGWGGIPQAFDASNGSWAKEYGELKALLPDAEYASARASTLNAHYTSPTVIKAIYGAVERMGFTTGNILEPACGVGNFFGLLPESMAGSNLYGVELDSITGRIAQQLYPQANIAVQGFEKTDRRDFYDLAIGNVPFGSYSVSDKTYDKLNFHIHDYFFAKALDQVRPGGVVAFITSKGTMDKQSPDVRKYIAQRAELLGAVRLPNNAFKANAGTEVTSDILFLQKRDRPLDIEPDWVHLNTTEDGIPINSYFADHPEMMLGKMAWFDNMYGNQKETACLHIEGEELADQLASAMQHITGQITEAELPDLGEDETIDTSMPADPDVSFYNFTSESAEV